MKDRRKADTNRSVGSWLLIVRRSQERVRTNEELSSRPGGRTSRKLTENKKTSMLYNSLNLEVAKIASKSEMRPEIAGVFFKNNLTAATDGFRLLEITTPVGVKPEEFPVVDGAAAMRGCQPFIVPARSLREIKIPKAKNGLPILQNVAIKYLDDKRAEFLTTDLETAKITTARRVEGKFPDYEQLWPAGAPAAEVVINGELLAELLGIMAKLDRTGAVKFKFYGKDKPVVVEAGETQKGRGMIMPIRE